ncbi:universal stress protein family, putative [Synechococcus sp. PCC 7335]|uniref:universal stress protein n=1 Tax=Synechococcus sp. (strain ATCC 29403 / PCC 7335) TaxID=91464 RepID=UPI00017EDCCF|nr:universal stress protein [Synechococcus sp. PCC 7335]EDX86416.1 universal stress protein family, putative [Synechococcus sp. PCC 7335]
MIQKILTALDYDDTCQSVFEQALDLAQATQSELKLLNVLALERDSSMMFSPYTDMDWREYEDQYRRLQTDSLKLLEDFAEKAKAVKVSADFAQEVGMAGPVICKLGKVWKADLIVVGSHGRKGLSEMLLGSVSNYVVHHATCSVMVVHQPD